MARIDIPLTGPSQTPDTRIGPPRITKLVNCMCDEQGKIVRSPGFAEFPSGSIGESITGGVAAFGGVQIYRSWNTDAGLSYARRQHETWHTHSEPQDFVSGVEAPRFRKLFSSGTPGLSYCSSTLLDVGNGDIVAVAEWMISGGAAGNGLTAFGLEWALLSGADGLEVVKRGKMHQTGPFDNAVYSSIRPAAAGRYLIGWGEDGGYDNSVFTIYRWNTDTREFEHIYSASGVVQQSADLNCDALDCVYAPNVDRLIVASPRNRLHMFNGTTGEHVGYYQYAAPGPFAGTMTLALLGTNAVAVAYASILSGTETNYYFRVGAQWITASGFGSLTNYERFTEAVAPNTKTYIPHFHRRAELCPGPAGSVIAVIPQQIKNNVASDTDDKIRGVVCKIVQVYPLQSGQPASHWGYATRRASATKPLWHPVHGPLFWTHNGADNASSLRSLELTGQDGSVTTFAAPASSSYTSTRKGFCAKTAVCVAGDPGVGPSWRDLGAVGNMVYSDRLPPIGMQTYRRRGFVALLPVLRRTDRKECDIYLSLVGEGHPYFAANGQYHDDLPDVGQTASAHGTTLVASGIPGSYATAPDTSGFLSAPLIPELDSSTDEYYDAEIATFTNVAVYRYTDSSGRIAWGPVSDPFVITGRWVGNVASLVERTNAFEDKCETVIFQLIDGVYRRTDGWLTRESGAGLDILYTQGAGGALAGALERWGCPPCRTIWAGTTRMICGGLANEFRAQVSNLFFPSECISWPRHPAFYIDVAEPITAVAALDDVFLIFSDRTIWAVTGPGPDASGAGTFNDPVRISVGEGARSWRSVVETPLGIFFQSPAGHIWLIQRGALQLTQVSGPIAEEIIPRKALMQGFVGNSHVTAAVYDIERREVWFLVYQKSFVLQIDSMTWRTESGSGQAGMAIGVGQVELNRAAFDFGTYVERYTGPVFFRAQLASYPRRITRGFYRPEEFADYNGSLSSRRMSLATSHIDLGRGRLSRVYIRAHAEFDYSEEAPYPAWECGVWFDGKGGVVSETRTARVGAVGEDCRADVQFEIAFARQKCNQFNLIVQEQDNSTNWKFWQILGIACDVEQTKQTPVRTQSGNGRFG